MTDRQGASPILFAKTIVCLAAIAFGSGFHQERTAEAQELVLKEAPLIRLDGNQAPSGRRFGLTVTIPSSLKVEQPKLAIHFVAGKPERPTTVRAEAIIDKIEVAADGKEQTYTVNAVVPPSEKIFEGVDKGWYEGWLFARKAELVITLTLAEPFTMREPFFVPSQVTASFWGAAIVLMLFAAFSLLKFNPFPRDDRFLEDTRARRWEDERKDWFKRVLALPLKYAITPTGRYSISSAQIQFWTAIVVFATVYVFMVRGEFLQVSQQMLVLLGISGGTALAAKVNAVARSENEVAIPAKYFKDLKRTRIPQVRDLVSIGGVPNIFKFQILAFTLVTGFIVLWKLYGTSNFPEIPAEQLLLMGISGGVYVGNEVAVEDAWKAIKNLVDEVGTKQQKASQLAAGDERKTLEADIDALEQKIPQMIKQIYS